MKLITEYTTMKDCLHRSGPRTAATSKMELFVMIVNGSAVNYYHTELHLGCSSSPRSASAYVW